MVKKLGIKTNLCFALPVHANSANDAHDHQRHGSYNPDIIDASINDLKTMILEQIVQRVAEADGVHTGRYGVGECEYDAD